MQIYAVSELNDLQENDDNYKISYDEETAIENTIEGIYGQTLFVEVSKKNITNQFDSIKINLVPILKDIYKKLSDLHTQINAAKGLNAKINKNTKDIREEIVRAKAAEQVNADTIAAETERAKGIESGLRTDLNKEINRSTDNDKNLTKKIETEIATAREAEKKLESNLTNHDTRITTLEKTTGSIPTNYLMLNSDSEQTVNGKVIFCTPITGTIDNALTANIANEAITTRWS